MHFNKVGYEKYNNDFKHPPPATYQQDLYHHNQMRYQDRIRKDNVDLRFENNNLLEDSRFNLDRQNHTILDQSLQNSNLSTQILHQQSFIKDLEYKLFDAQKFNTSNEQEVYRMRIKYSEMSTQLEKIIKDKDSIIYDSRKKISDLVSEKTELQEQLQLQTDINKDMLEKMKQLQQGIAAKQGPKDKKPKKDDSGEIKEFQRVIEELQTKLQQMQLENERLNKYIIQLKEDNFNLKEINRKLVLKKEKVENPSRLESQEEERQMKNDLLNLPMVAEAESIKKINREQVEEIEKLKIRNEELENDANEVQLEMDILRRKLKELEQHRKIQQDEEKLKAEKGQKQVPVQIQPTQGQAQQDQTQGQP